jgi:hypothetical protein
MANFNELSKKAHVQNHPLFKNRSAQLSAMRTNMSKRAQDLDLSDIFSQKRQVGLKGSDRTINAYIQESALAARAALDILDFPIRPQLSYNNVRRVKYSSYDPAAVVDAELLFNIRMASKSGVICHATIPVNVKAGMVIPPSIIMYEDRPRIIAQSTVDEIINRHTSYSLEPLRGQFSPPLSGEELDIGVSNRNELGYQPREVNMDATGVRRTNRRRRISRAEILAGLDDLSRDLWKPYRLPNPRDYYTDVNEEEAQLAVDSQVPIDVEDPEYELGADDLDLEEFDPTIIPSGKRSQVKKSCTEWDMIVDHIVSKIC